MLVYRYVRFTVLSFFLIIAMSAVAQEATAGRTTSIEVADGVHLLVGFACNIVAVSGQEGVLLIDNGSADTAGQLKEAINALGSGQVRIAINTHFHFDHIGANEQLSKDGVVIVAHDGVRQNMQTEWRLPNNTPGIKYPPVPPYPETALPMLTLNNVLTVHFRGEEIEVRYFPDAHSDADVAVFLRGANVLHTGDLYLSNGFPIIDSFHGGTIDGVIAAVDTLISLIDDDTKVVPGHGPVSNREGLREYRQLLGAGRVRIATLIEEGKTLEEIVAADPLAGLYRQGESWLPPRLFIWTVYRYLSPRH
ncbi:MAG: MBL fold metallo-hydrolase [bacterium]